MRRHVVRMVAATAVVGGLVATFGGVAPTPASAAPQPITLALITSLSGAAAAEYSDSPAGFRARIALQNAQEGQRAQDRSTRDQRRHQPDNRGDRRARRHIEGRPGHRGEQCTLLLGGEVPPAAGSPGDREFPDGPEWGEQPYTNMFAADDGSVDPKYPVNTGAGLFLKQHGGTVIGTYGYSISPSSTRSAIGVAQSFDHAGGKTGVVDTSVPFGGVDFTTAALTAKSKGVNTIWAAMDNGSNFALATSLRQAGVKLKAVVFPTGYEPGVINTPAWQAVQGDYFVTQYCPFSLPNAATLQMASALQKYQVSPNLPSRLRPVRVVAWCRPHDQGHPEGRPEPKPDRSHQACGASKVTMATAYCHTRSTTRRSSVTTSRNNARGASGAPERVRGPSTQPLCGRDIAGTSTAQS